MNNSDFSFAQAEKDFLVLDAEESTLRNLREQLLSVQTIRYEHQRKDNLITALKERIGELENDQESTKKKLSRIGVLEDKLNQFLNLEQKYEAMKNELEIMSTSYSQLDIEHKAITLKEANQSQMIESLQREVSKLETKLSLQDESVAKWMNNMSESTKREIYFKLESEKYKEENINLQDTIASLKKAIRSHQTYTQDIEEKLVLSDIMHNEVKSELKVKVEDVTRWKAMYDDLEVVLRTVKDQSVAVSKFHTNEINELKAKIKTIESSSDEKQDYIDQISETITVFTNRVEEMLNSDSKNNSQSENFNTALKTFLIDFSYPSNKSNKKHHHENQKNKSTSLIDDPKVLLGPITNILLNLLETNSDMCREIQKRIFEEYKSIEINQKYEKGIDKLNRKLKESNSQLLLGDENILNLLLKLDDIRTIQLKSDEKASIKLLLSSFSSASAQSQSSSSSSSPSSPVVNSMIHSVKFEREQLYSLLSEAFHDISNKLSYAEHDIAVLRERNSKLEDDIIIMQEVMDNERQTKIEEIDYLSKSNLEAKNYSLSRENEIMRKLEDLKRSESHTQTVMKREMTNIISDHEIRLENAIRNATHREELLIDEKEDYEKKLTCAMMSLRLLADQLIIVQRKVKDLIDQKNFLSVFSKLYWRLKKDISEVASLCTDDDDDDDDNVVGGRIYYSEKSFYHLQIEAIGEKHHPSIRVLSIAILFVHRLQRSHYDSQSANFKRRLYRFGVNFSTKSNKCNDNNSSNDSNNIDSTYANDKSEDHYHYYKASALPGKNSLLCLSEDENIRSILLALELEENNNNKNNNNYNNESHIYYNQNETSYDSYINSNSRSFSRILDEDYDINNLSTQSYDQSSSLLSVIANSFSPPIKIRIQNEKNAFNGFYTLSQSRESEIIKHWISNMKSKLKSYNSEHLSSKVIVDELKRREENNEQLLVELDAVLLHQSQLLAAFQGSSRHQADDSNDQSFFRQSNNFNDIRKSAINAHSFAGEIKSEAMKSKTYITYEKSRKLGSLSKDSSPENKYRANRFSDINASPSNNTNYSLNVSSNSSTNSDNGNHEDFEACHENDDVFDAANADVMDSFDKVLFINSRFSLNHRLSSKDK